MSEQTGSSRVIPQAVLEETLQADLERYRQLAIALGATDAKAIPATWVEVDERVRLKCLIPRCGNYGVCPSCPPFMPEPDFFRNAFARYHWALLFKQDVIPPSLVADQREFTKRRDAEGEKEIAKIAARIETAAFADGYYLALGLGSGGCKLVFCRGVICQVLDSGRCRFPLKARPSMEAACIDVFGLVTRVGWDIYPIYATVDPEAVPCALTVGMVFIW